MTTNTDITVTYEKTSYVKANGSESYGRRWVVKENGNEVSNHKCKEDADWEASRL